MTELHKHVKCDYKKFTRISLLRRIESLEQYVKWLEQRDQAIDRTRAMFHGKAKEIRR